MIKQFVKDFIQYYSPREIIKRIECFANSMDSFCKIVKCFDCEKRINIKKCVKINYAYMCPKCWEKVVEKVKVCKNNKGVVDLLDITEILGLVNSEELKNCKVEIKL